MDNRLLPYITRAIYASLAFIAVSCGKESPDSMFRTVQADITQVDTIYINSGRVVELEANDSSLLYGISNIEKSGGRLIIHSRDLLKSFDPNNGRYLGTIATKGAGPEEFNAINQVWVESDTIRLLDFNTRSLISYLSDGRFISRNKAFMVQDNPGHSITAPVYLMKYPVGNAYISLNCFTDGTTASNPTASLYDSHFKYIRDIEGRSLREGSYLSDRMTTDFEGKRLLMWEPFRDTLFIVTTDSIKPWIAFDFGKNSFPAEYQALPEMFERMQKFLGGKNIPYVSYLHSYQKLGDLLFFSLSTAQGNHYLGLLDLKEDTMKIYSVVDPDMRYKQKNYIKIVDGELYIVVNDTRSEEANPALFIIPTDYFR